MVCAWLERVLLWDSHGQGDEQKLRSGKGARISLCTPHKVGQTRVSVNPS